MIRHTVVISDIHLGENERHAGDWMRYRRAEHAPDEMIDALVTRLLERVAPPPESDPGDPERLTLVLAGDVFDFDGPRVRDGESYFHDERRNEENDVPAIERTLRDHPVAIRAFARVLAAGGRLVVLTGNHDAQLNLPRVRAAVRKALLGAARELGCDHPDLVFRSWFYKGEDGVLVEHGHQYDPYCSYHYPMTPFAPADEHAKSKTSAAAASDAVQPTMGSLATRLLIGRMGYFNPHVDATYTLSVRGYFSHWIRRYVFSPHSLLLSWFFGSLRVAKTLLEARDAGDDERSERDLRMAIEETGEPAELLEQHRELFAKPVELTSRYTFLRELYLDRLGLLSLIAASGGLSFAVPSLWPWLPLSFVGVLIAHELWLPGPTVAARWKQVDDAMRKIAELHGVRAVVFGHTHHPHGAWEGDLFIGNSGTWAPAFLDTACKKPLYPKRPLIWLTSDNQQLRGGLFGFDGETVSVYETSQPASVRPIASPLGTPAPATGR